MKNAKKYRFGGYQDFFRDQRRTEGNTRQQARNARSNTDQLAVLDARLGSGVGAAQERARLSK